MIKHLKRSYKKKKNNKYEYIFVLMCSKIVCIQHIKEQNDNVSLRVLNAIVTKLSYSNMPFLKSAFLICECKYYVFPIGIYLVKECAYLDTSYTWIWAFIMVRFKRSATQCTWNFRSLFSIPHFHIKLENRNVYIR